MEVVLQFSSQCVMADTLQLVACLPSVRAREQEDVESCLAGVLF